MSFDIVVRQYWNLSKTKVNTEVGEMDAKL